MVVPHRTAPCFTAPHRALPHRTVALPHRTVLYRTAPHRGFSWPSSREQWADEYFMIKHRGETRGLGGIFFDDQNDKGGSRVVVHK